MSGDIWVRWVECIADLPQPDVDRLVSPHGAFRSWHYLQLLEADRRWRSRYACAFVEGILTAVIPVYEAVPGARVPKDYAAGRWHARMPAGSTSARLWFVGGRTDRMASGMRSQAEPFDPALRSTSQTVWDDAARSGSLLVFDHVQESELRCLVPPGSQPSWMQDMEPEYSLTLSTERPIQEAPALRSSARQLLRRDVRAIAVSGLDFDWSTDTRWCDPVFRAIEATYRRYGAEEHRSLIELRLRRWWRLPGVTPYLVRCKHRDSFIGGCLVATWRETCHVLDIGVHGESGPLRQLAYVGLAFHAPAALAAQAGCTRLGLGTGADVPKRLRGATATRVVSAIFRP